LRIRNRGHVVVEAGNCHHPGICDEAPAFAPVVIAGRQDRRHGYLLTARRCFERDLISRSLTVVRVIGHAETEAIVAVLQALRRAS